VILPPLVFPALAHEKAQTLHTNIKQGWKGFSILIRTLRKLQ